MEDQVSISQEAIDELLRDIDGPIGDLMKELAEQMADIARIKVRVRVPGLYHTGRTSNARTPGYTKSHITTTVGHSVMNNGYVFAGANAPGDPAFFLEAPAEQMNEKYPFLSTALNSVWLE